MCVEGYHASGLAPSFALTDYPPLTFRNFTVRSPSSTLSRETPSVLTFQDAFFLRITHGSLVRRRGYRDENYNENLACRPGFYALRSIAQHFVHDLATFKG